MSEPIAKFISIQELKPFIDQSLRLFGFDFICYTDKEIASRFFKYDENTKDILIYCYPPNADTEKFIIAKVINGVNKFSIFRSFMYWKDGILIEEERENILTYGNPIETITMVCKTFNSAIFEKEIENLGPIFRSMP